MLACYSNTVSKMHTKQTKNSFMRSGHFIELMQTFVEPLCEYDAFFFRHVNSHALSIGSSRTSLLLFIEKEDI